MALKIETANVWSRLQTGLGQLDKTSRSTLNRATVTLGRRWPAQAKRDISSQFALKPSKISKTLKAKVSGGSVSLTAFGRPQPLISFPARQPKRGLGVIVQIENGKPVLIAHAFIQVPVGAPQAGPMVFIRLSALGDLPDGVTAKLVNGNRTKHGYPIALLRGPTVADMLAAGDREDRLFDFAQKVLADEFDRLNIAEVLRGQ